MIKIGICGFGYWGPILFRGFASNRAFSVTAIADCRPEARAKARAIDKSVQIFDDTHELFDSGCVDAVAIATPVSTHHPLAAHALRRGLHVLVEKPLAASVEEAKELVALADKHKVALIVDHIYVFHEVVRAIKELIQNNALGSISYYDSLRVNLGLFQPDMNVLWDLAPHDLSILDYLFEEEPIHVEATGYCHVNPHLPDITYVTLHYAKRMIAHLNLSWMSPVKVRRIAVGGNKKMAIWDDLNADERLKIYDSGIEYQSEEQRSAIVPSYRIGDVYSPRLSSVEPVSRLLEHFANVISERQKSPVDGLAGLRVVTLLEKTQRALSATLDVPVLAVDSHER